MHNYEEIIEPIDTGFYWLLSKSQDSEIRLYNNETIGYYDSNAKIFIIDGREWSIWFAKKQFLIVKSKIISPLTKIDYEQNAKSDSLTNASDLECY